MLIPINRKALSYFPGLKKCLLVSACWIALMPTSSCVGDNTRAETATNNDNATTAMCEKQPMTDSGIVRLSKIEIYPEYYDEYKAFACEVGRISLQIEPGVIAMYAMEEKDAPCMITILEIYSSREAYESHISSSHFQTYKQSTLKMVKSLELVDQSPLNPSNQIQSRMLR